MGVTCRSSSPRVQNVQRRPVPVSPDSTRLAVWFCLACVGHILARNFSHACEQMIAHPGSPIQARISQIGSNSSAPIPVVWDEMGHVVSVNVPEYQDCARHCE